MERTLPSKNDREGEKHVETEGTNSGIKDGDVDNERLKETDVSNFAKQK